MTKMQIEYIRGKTGFETVKVNGYFLHSKYNPIREAADFAKKNYRIGDVHILFGYGKGYIVDALLKEFKSDEKLIVIEPFLSIEDVSRENAIIIQSSSIEEILKELNKYSALFTLNNVQILCSPNYDKICPDLFKELLLKLKEKVTINKVNLNTINYMALQWQRNYLYNIKHAIHDHSIQVLHKYTNSPVVVASGGPSLTKQIPLLKKIREKVILICSGSTINTLLKENIEPDYVVSIDSQESNYRHFKALKLKNAKLIYHMYNHYKIRECFNSDAFYFISMDEKNLISHLSKIVNKDVVPLNGGATVATYAFTFANYISSGPIALIGQDLAFTDNKSHAENNLNFTIITEETLKNKQVFYVEGYYGDKVLTDSSLLTMREVFQNLAKIINNENIYNCTEGGARIEHIKQISFKEFIERFVKDQTPACPIKMEKKDINYKEIISLFNSELKRLDKIKRLVNENLRLVSANKSNTHFTADILKKMDKNDEIIEKERQNTCLQVILDPLSIAILKNFKPKNNNETPEEAYIRVVQQNKALYKGYLEAIDTTKQFIKDLCEELKLEGDRR